MPPAKNQLSRVVPLILNWRFHHIPCQTASSPSAIGRCVARTPMMIGASLDATELILEVLGTEGLSGGRKGPELATTGVLESGCK